MKRLSTAIFALLCALVVAFAQEPTKEFSPEVHPDGSVYIITESAAAPYAVQSKNPIDYVIKWDINNMK